MPYRSQKTTLPTHAQMWARLFRQVLGMLVSPFIFLRDTLVSWYAPKCKTDGNCTQFVVVEELSSSWALKEQHDVLYLDRPIVGEKGDGFYYGSRIPHRVACEYCGRPFRIGDPIPKGASLDHWHWSPGVRQRPEYLSEHEWAELESSGYFNRR